MKKLLVTGASGFLGQEICLAAKVDWRVFGLVLSHDLAVGGVSALRIDLSIYKDLKRAFEQIGPDAVIHCAAVSNPNYCQLHREETQRINVDASTNIAGLCADRKIPCLFTSTDLVFDGLHAPYSEEDPLCPVSAYGEQKVRAEVEMQRRHSQVTICRMPLMFGDPKPPAQSFIQPMIESMKKGGDLRLFTDEFRTPISGAAAAQGILVALNQVKGVLHLGGVERISRYRFGLLLKDALGLSNARLIPALREDAQMPAPRPPDVSLDSTKAKALGFKPTPLKEQLTTLFPGSDVLAVGP
jgi:dTDP-4-dehydrorhamnose reductase